METAIQTGHGPDTNRHESQHTQNHEAEQRISTLEDELQDSPVRLQTTEKHATTLADKLVDLENRARRNNLRLVGLPKHIKATELTMICKRDIPKALGLENECDIERTYRSGNPQT